MVAEGVYFARARAAAVGNCNAGIFVNNPADVLVVDAHSKPSAAAALIAQIKREVTPEPVRYLVDTHFHWDPRRATPLIGTRAPRFWQATKPNNCSWSSRQNGCTNRSTPTDTLSPASRTSRRSLILLAPAWLAPRQPNSERRSRIRSGNWRHSLKK